MGKSWSMVTSYSCVRGISSGFLLHRVTIENVNVLCI
jgi:hypothetical protein